MKRSRLRRLFQFVLFITIIGLFLPGIISLFQAGAGKQAVVEAAPMQQDGPSIAFDPPANITVREGIDDVAEVSVRLSESPDEDFTVTIRTLDGTARAAQDYATLNRQLVFPANTNNLTQSVEIDIINDTVPEPTEFFYVTLENPINGGITPPNTITIFIQDTDPTATPTTSGVTVFADAQEPNDTFTDATDLIPDGPDLCDLTLWPIGDIDFFKFNGKAGTTYRIYTSNLEAGVDTFMRVYGPSLNLIGSNDDEPALGSKASSVTIVANADGFYYVEITNVSPTDPTNKKYCIEVDTVPAFTPTPSNTPVPGADDCEFNSTFDTACTVGVGEEVNLSFVPVLGSERDTDILRLWVLPGVLYTCETFDLSPVTDTNIILYDQNRQPFNPWIGNADRAPGDPSSEVQYLATYKGYIYVMIGPENVPPYEESNLHTYKARCTATIATATPTPQPTFAPPPGGGGGVPAATSTPAEAATAVPTPTPIDLSFLTQVPPTRPVVGISPLPTSTAVASGAQSITINVTLYYDSNENFTPELTEGIMDAAIALYDNATGQLIAFGYTNEAGMAQFSNVVASGPVRVVVPFLNYSQVIVGAASDILIRVAPQPLPVGIP